MIKQSDIEKLIRFSKGLSDADETQYIHSLFAEKENSNELKYYLMDEWKKHFGNNEDQHDDVSYLLDRIHHKIHYIDNRRKEPIRRKVYRWYSAAAAILLVPLLIAGAIWFTSSPAPETVVVAEKPVTSTI